MVRFSKNKRKKDIWIAIIIWMMMALTVITTFASCGSEEKVAIQSCERVWNVDEDLNNAFWGAVELMKAHGVNVTKLKEEDLNVFLVDEFSTEASSSNSVALATWINKDGIRIEVLKSKWEKAVYTNQEDLMQRNMLTMLHEIGHDYFDLSHHEGEWDIMNATGLEGDEISDDDISNSLNRMIMEGRRNYDKEALRKRF